MKTFQLCFSVSIVIFSSWVAQARPEYANRVKMSCTSCHFNPMGGGPRNIMGKAFGSRSLGMAKTSMQDLVYGDFRSLYYLPERPSKSPNGFALMKATVTLQGALKADPGKASLYGVASYDFGQLSSNHAREVYFIWTQAELNKWAPNRYLVGRFYLPFGLMTDEHRSYTRIQTNTTMRDFDLGLLVSGDPTTHFHYDFSISNGFRSSGGAFTEAGDQTFAVTTNGRWMSQTVPTTVGVSVIHQSSQINRPNPTAVSLYNVWALDQLLESLPKSDLSLEVVVADEYNRGTFNNILSNYFIGSNSSFGDGVEFSQSLGALIDLKIHLSDSWTLLYKFDHISLDQEFAGDRFIRHGLGFRYQFDSNASLLVKAEMASVGRDDLDETQMVGAQNSIAAVLRIWL